MTTTWFKSKERRGSLDFMCSIHQWKYMRQILIGLFFKNVEEAGILVAEAVFEQIHYLFLLPTIMRELSNSLLIPF